MQTFFELVDYAEEIGKRLRSAALRRELLSPQKLAEAMTEGGFEIGAAGVKKHWYGKVIPNGVNCIGYSKVLGVSIDWLLIGVEPPRKYSVSELKKIVTGMIVDGGGEIPERDPETIELMRLISQVESSEQKALAIRVLKAVVGEN